MSVKIQLKHSSVQSKVPLATDLVNGELALNINAASPAAYIKDSAGNVIQLAGVSGSATAPTSPTTGAVWIDSSQTPNVINVWNGTSWIPQAGATIASGTAPATPATGQIWVDTSVSPNVTNIWDGTSWVTVTAGGSDAQAIANDAKYATKEELTAADDWQRTGTELSPVNAGDSVFTSGAVKVGGTTAAPNLQIAADGGIVANTDGLVYDAATKRLGVGTSSPSQLMHVEGGNLLVNQNGTASSIFITTDTNRDANVYFGDSDGAGMGRIRYANAADYMQFYTAASANPAIHITSTGSVGIGTASPNYVLETAGDPAFIGVGTSVNGVINIVGRNSAGSGTAVAKIESEPSGATNAASLIFKSKNTSNAVLEGMRLDSSQRLLVGTSSAPTSGQGQYSRLVVQGNSGGAGGGYFAIQRTSASTLVDDVEGVISFNDNSGNTFAQIVCATDGTPGANDYPGRLVFSTTPDGASSPTERMRLTSAGRLLLNTTSESTPASGQLSIDAALNNNNAIVIQNTDTQGPAQYFAIFYNSAGAIAGSIAHSGSTAVAFNTSSDYRLKENIVPLTGAADRVNQLQVRRFNFIAEPGKTVDGFIAHEAQAIVPECVTGTKDEVDADGKPVYQGIDQSKLVPLLTAALQEALAKIETLEARLTAAGI